MFSASGRVITFHGFLKAYVEGTDDAASAATTTETRLPALDEGDARLGRRRCSASGHETKPPARYTEATLIKELEEREIGRPSTYASIIGTILNRGYVYKKGTALVPAWLAFSVIRLLEEHFPRQVSYEFTAGMEDVLDEIAAGRKDRVTELARVLLRLRPGRRACTPLVTGLGDIDARELATFPVGDAGQRHQPAGRPLRPLPRGPRRRGQPGRQAGQRARGPAARRADPREGQGAVRQPGRRGDRARRRTPRPGCRSWRRTAASAPTSPRCCPRTRPSAPSRAPARCSSRCRWTRSPSTTRSSCCRCRAWSAPTPSRRGDHRAERPLRAVPQEGHRLPVARPPRTSCSRSPSTRRCAIYAQPKQRGRAAAAAPLKELGNDPVSGQPVVVKAGRFGEYVTDGEYNATLRKDDTVEAITLERAAELLAERRARGPAKKAGRRRTAKKATAKKTAQEDGQEGRRKKS